MLEKSVAQKKREWELENCIVIRPSVQFRPDPATFPQWRPTAFVTLVLVTHAFNVLLAAQKTK